MNLASLVSPSSHDLDGALTREAAVAGAHPKFDARYVIFAVGIAPMPELAEAARTHARALKEAMPLWHAGYDYDNFVDTPAEGEVVLPHASCPRVRETKPAYDPDQAIISAHPVRPARS